MRETMDAYREVEVVKIKEGLYKAFLRSDPEIRTAQSPDGEARDEVECTMYETEDRSFGSTQEAEAWFAEHRLELMEHARKTAELASEDKLKAEARAYMGSTDYRNFKVLQSMDGFREAAEILYPGWLDKVEKARETV